MPPEKIVVTGTGCALADFLYNGVSFDSPAFKRYLSKQQGDGGLSIGKLVFIEEFEKFAGKPYGEILKEITGKLVPDSFNIGGPGLVSLIHAAQLLDQDRYKVRFFGSMGNDDVAQRIVRSVNRAPLDITHYKPFSSKPTPYTHVFSDPDYDQGHGERTFVNNIGAAWDYLPEMLSDDFYNSHIMCFGGTALVPEIHDSLDALLKKAKQHNAITVVNTVFDFRNEKLNPGRPWPLVHSDACFELIDVLIMDLEEAKRISGLNNPEDIQGFFMAKKVSSFIITNGANDLVAYSDGRTFEKTSPVYFPVSRMVTDDLRKQGDTTGCGDNFAGGIIASLAEQKMAHYSGLFSLTEAIALAVASGAFACGYLAEIIRKHGEVKSAGI